MWNSYTLGQTSLIVRVRVFSSSTNNGLTGLTNSSSGLIISTICDNESSPTAFTSSGSTIDSITTLGTYATPATGHCRFKEVSSTDHPGTYELQLANARFSVSGAKYLLITISGVSGMYQCDILIPLLGMDPYNTVSLGLSALPSSSAGTSGGLPICGTGNNQIILTSGQVQTSNPGSAPTAAQVATAVWQDTIGSSDLTATNSIGKLIAFGLPSSAAGSPGGLATIGGVLPSYNAGASGGLPTIGGVIPQANAGSSGGLPTVTSGNQIGIDLTNIKQATTATTLSNITIPTVTSITNSVTVGTNNDKTGYSLLQAFPTNFSILSINGSGQIQTSNPGSAPTAAQIATAVLTDTLAGDLNVSGSIGVAILTNLDAKVSTRSTLAAGAQMDLVSSPNSSAITAIQSGLATGSAQSALQTTANTIETQTSKIGTNNADSPNQATAQTTISTNLDVKVSTRSTYAGADTAGTTTLLSRVGQAIPFASDGNVKCDAQGTVVVGGYASGQAPATTSQIASSILQFPSNLLWTASNGDVNTTDGGTTPGIMAVNQDTGGTDNLRYVTIDGGGNTIGVEGAAILLYVASDWPDNPENVQARACTGSDGRWLSPAFVNPGTYVAVFVKPQADGPDVSAPITV